MTEGSQEELVTVFDTEQESEAMVVQGLLESAGIENILTSIEATQEVLPGVGGVFVKVGAERAAEARKLIEDFRANPASESAPGDDTTVSGEPTA